MEIIAEPCACVNHNLDVITCCKCLTVSIPAPEGTTPKTRYVCPACSPLSSDDIRFHYDRTQFDRCGPRAQINSLTLIVEHQGELAKFSSVELVRNRRMGIAWAENATPERIMSLPIKQRLSFLTRMCVGMTATESCYALEDNFTCVENNLNYAKRSLCRVRTPSALRLPQRSRQHLAARL